jgi:serine/threonine-protein kinase RsbW
MPFEVDLLAVDPDLGREFAAAVATQRTRLRPLESAPEFVARATSEPLPCVVVVIDDAARLDAAWWRSVRARAPQAQLLVACRTCDDETWRRWLLLGCVNVVRPPFAGLDLEAEFAGEPALGQMFRRLPELAALGKAMFRYSFPSDPQYIPGVVHVVSLLALEFGYSTADWATNVPLAVDEAISNAIKHGNRRDPRKRVEVEGQVDAEQLRIKVRDEGDGFERDRDHDPVDPANLLAPSGRGLFLIESVMDDVRYTQDGRCIEMVKRAAGAGATAKKR